MLTQCRHGRARAVIISGSPGSGKTELLHTFLARLGSNGTPPLIATGTEVGRNTPLGIVGQLFRRVMPQEQLYKPVIPVGRTVETVSGTSTGRMRTRAGGNTTAFPTQRSAALLESIGAVLVDLATKGPLVIAVDDAHHADEQSIDALLHLWRRLSFSQVLFVLTQRTPMPARPTVVSTEFGGHPHTMHVTLAPLSRTGVHELLNRELDGAVTWETTDRAVELTGGNPLLLSALAQDGRGAPFGAPERAVAGLPAGREFARVLLGCVRRLDPALVDVLRCVTLLETGTPAHPGAPETLLAAVLEISPMTAAQALAMLDTAGLLCAGRPRHRLARDTILETIPAEVRADTHRRAAVALRRIGAPPSQIAFHLAAADQVRDQSETGVLRSAAEEHLRDHQPEAAARMLELAAQNCTEPAESRRLEVLLLTSEWRHDPTQAARHLGPLLEAHVQNLLSVDDSTQLVRFLLWYGRLGDALDVLVGIVNDNPAECAQPAVASVAGWLRAFGPITSSPSTNFSADAAALIREAARVEVPEDVTAGGFTSIPVIAAAEQVLRGAGSGDTAISDQLVILLTLIRTDQLERAAQHCDALLADTGIHGERTLRAILTSARAEVALRTGDLPAAAEHAKEALRSVPPHGWGLAIGAPLATALTVATAMGNHREAAALLRTQLPESLPDTQFGRFVLHARGHHLLATGRPMAALDCFQRCGDLQLEHEADLPSLVPWRSGAAQAQLVLGDCDAARELLETQLARLDDDPRGRGSTLRLLAATVPPGARIRMLHESIELLRESGDTLTLARALLDLSTTYGYTNELGQAWQLAQRALQLAHQSHADPPRTRRAEPVVESPAEAGPTDYSGALSDAERRVVTLARDGCTNREISARLHITVSTVEQHLTHAYRKLGVTRRSQLHTVMRAEVRAGAAELGEPA